MLEIKEHLILREGLNIIFQVNMILFLLWKNNSNGWLEVFSIGQNPTTKEAQSIADEIFAEFVSEEVDKVELIYTKFISLISSSPTIQTILPLTPEGEICDIDGNCVDAAEDEIFRLTSIGGEFAVLILSSCLKFKLSTFFIIYRLKEKRSK